MGNQSIFIVGRCVLQTKGLLQCKSYFQSVIDNAKLEDLRQEADRKLKSVEEEEKKESKVEG